MRRRTLCPAHASSADSALFPCHCGRWPQGQQQISVLCPQLQVHVRVADCIAHVALTGLVFPRMPSVTNFMLVKYLVADCRLTDCFSNCGG